MRGVLLALYAVATPEQQHDVIVTGANRGLGVYVWHDVYMCGVAGSWVTGRIHVRHGAFICDMTHLCVT